MIEPYEVTPGVHILPSSLALGPLGMLPINAFLVKTKSPYLVDTGAIIEGAAFIASLETLIDPGDLELIYLTHTDPDHIGGLERLLARAPRAKLATSFLGNAKLAVMGIHIPEKRLHLLNPGEQLEYHRHRLTVARPAVYDAPETTCLYDSALDVLFSADSFGAPLKATFRFAEEIPAEDLLEGELLWATVDAPWVHGVDRAGFAAILRQFEKANPEWILSSHLPPAHRMAQTLCANVAQAPDAPPFAQPTQAQFEQMLGSGAGAQPQA